MAVYYRFRKSFNPTLNALISDATKLDNRIAEVPTELMLMPLIAQVDRIARYYCMLDETASIVTCLRQSVRIRQGEFILSQIENEEA